MVSAESDSNACEVEEVSAESDSNACEVEEVSAKIITLPNIISLVRLIMAPIAFVLLVQGRNLAACALFSVSAATDFLDGQIARRTHTVTRLGQLLDPAVDRLLMICGVLGLLVVGWLPAWIVVLVIARDLFLLFGASWLMKNFKIRVPVVYAGKFATTFLFIGFAGLMLAVPQVPGLGWCDVAWLPGFNGASCSWGIWPVYIGLALGVFTTLYYVMQAIRALFEARDKER